MNMVKVIRVRLERSTPLSKEESEPAYQFAREYDAFGTKLKALTPFLLADILEGLSCYLDSFAKVKAVVTMQDGATMPSDSELDGAFAQFAFVCVKTICKLRDST